MAILTHNEILEEIKKKNIKITPFKSVNLGPASYDLTLDNKFRLFNRNLKCYEIHDSTDYKKISYPIKCNTLTLEPGDFALGITKEQIKLPSTICAWLSGRTRYARLGLGVHVTANFIQPGVNNKQILELKNLGKTPIKIKTGTKVIQIIFERTEGKAIKYTGKFGKQTTI
jgi:dCTP deaminase